MVDRMCRARTAYPQLKDQSCWPTPSVGAHRFYRLTSVSAEGRTPETGFGQVRVERAPAGAIAAPRSAYPAPTIGRFSGFGHGAETPTVGALSSLRVRQVCSGSRRGWRTAVSACVSYRTRAHAVDRAVR